MTRQVNSQAAKFRNYFKPLGEETTANYGLEKENVGAIFVDSDVTHFASLPQHDFLLFLVLYVSVCECVWVYSICC